jgi:hypothetical protein
MIHPANPRRSLALSLVLAASAALACAGTTTPNAFSQSRTKYQIEDDEEKCFQEGMVERRRLLTELVEGDPATLDRAERVGAAKSAARTMTKMEGGSTASGDASAAVADFLFSSWDSDDYDEEMLAKYLGIEGGLGAGFSATIRLKHMCLRNMGYQVDRYGEDGKGTVHLMWDPARGLIREEDGTERVFYQYVP